MGNGVTIASKNDTDTVLGLLYEFYHESGYSAVCGLDKDSVRVFVAKVIENESSDLLLINDVGIAGIALSPFYFNQKNLFAQELFWYIKPESRKAGLGMKLLESVEEWAKEKGATVLSMNALSSLNPHIVPKFYKKHGFKNMESVWMKVL